MITIHIYTYFILTIGPLTLWSGPLPYKIIFACSRTLSMYMDMKKSDKTSKAKKLKIFNLKNRDQNEKKRVSKKVSGLNSVHLICDSYFNFWFKCWNRNRKLSVRYSTLNWCILIPITSCLHSFFMITTLIPILQVNFFCFTSVYIVVNVFRVFGCIFKIASHGCWGKYCILSISMAMQLKMVSTG